jgi:hypothetical protein
MVGFLGIKSHLETNNLSYFIIYPKSEKSIKAAITPAAGKHTC